MFLTYKRHPSDTAQAMAPRRGSGGPGFVCGAQGRFWNPGASCHEVVWQICLQISGSQAGGEGGGFWTLRDIWQHLETFWVVTTGVGEALLALGDRSQGRGKIYPDTLAGPHHKELTIVVPRWRNPAPEQTTYQHTNYDRGLLKISAHKILWGPRLFAYSFRNLLY